MDIANALAVAIHDALHVAAAVDEMSDVEAEADKKGIGAVEEAVELGLGFDVGGDVVMKDDADAVASAGGGGLFQTGGEMAPGGVVEAVLRGDVAGQRLAVGVAAVGDDEDVASECVEVA